MAEVFLARCLRAGEGNRLLAIKRTLPEFASDNDFVSMFMDEATIAHGLVHPHICTIYDQGRSGDQLFIVMEFLHGKDLKVVQHRARELKDSIPYSHLAYIIARTADGLHCAHNKKNAHGEPQGIVHRDVSPHNILVTYDGVPKLIDFGIAKAKNRLVQTQVGIIKGKFAYMAPEQATGGNLDHRTDIFALGVVLYELVTGYHAFKASSDISTLQRIAKAEYAPPQELQPSVPNDLVDIIKKALARHAHQRYSSAAAMASELDDFVARDSTFKPSSLASYMRKLFQQDFTREIARVKEYLAYSLPAPPRPAHDSEAANAQEAPWKSGRGDDASETSAEAPMVADDVDMAPSQIFNAENFMPGNRRTENRTTDQSSATEPSVIEFDNAQQRKSAEGIRSPTSRRQHRRRRHHISHRRMIETSGRQVTDHAPITRETIRVRITTLITAGRAISTTEAKISTYISLRKRSTWRSSRGSRHHVRTARRVHGTGARVVHPDASPGYVAYPMR